jgi:hypothetical protein
LSDLFTKLLPQARREALLDRFTYWSNWFTRVSIRGDRTNITVLQYLVPGGSWVCASSYVNYVRYRVM